MPPSALPSRRQFLSGVPAITVAAATSSLLPMSPRSTTTPVPDDDQDWCANTHPWCRSFLLGLSRSIDACQGAAKLDPVCTCNDCLGVESSEPIECAHDILSGITSFHTVLVIFYAAIDGTRLSHSGSEFDTDAPMPRDVPGDHVTVQREFLLGLWQARDAIDEAKERAPDCRCDACLDLAAFRLVLSLMDDYAQSYLSHKIPFPERILRIEEVKSPDELTEPAATLYRRHLAGMPKPA